MQYTSAMGIGAVKMFCKGATFRAVQEEYGITSGGALIRIGVRYLMNKHQLEFPRDTQAKIGYVLTQADKDKLYELAEGERDNIRKKQLTPIEQLINKPRIIDLIDQIHAERIELQKKFNSLTDKILQIERHIKSKL